MSFLTQLFNHWTKIWLKSEKKWLYVKLQILKLLYIAIQSLIVKIRNIIRTAMIIQYQNKCKWNTPYKHINKKVCKIWYKNQTHALFSSPCSSRPFQMSCIAFVAATWFVSPWSHPVINRIFWKGKWNNRYNIWNNQWY